MLNASLVSQAVHNDNRIPIAQGHLYYTFIQSQNPSSVNPMNSSHIPNSSVVQHAPPNMFVPIRRFLPRDESDEIIPDSQSDVSDDSSKIVFPRSFIGLIVRTNEYLGLQYPTDYASMSSTADATYFPSTNASRRQSMEISRDSDPEDVVAVSETIDPRSPQPKVCTTRIVYLGVQLDLRTDLQPSLAPLTYPTSFVRTESKSPSATTEHRPKSNAEDTHDEENPPNAAKKTGATIRTLMRKAQDHLNAIGRLELNRSITEDYVTLPQYDNPNEHAVKSEPSSPIRLSTPRQLHDFEECFPDDEKLETVCVMHNLTYDQHDLLYKSGMNIEEVSIMDYSELMDHLRAIIGTTVAQYSSSETGI